MARNKQGDYTLYSHHVVEVSDPVLYEEIFPYSEIPKIEFYNKDIPYQMPDDIWITDTTFRDGQQSMASFTVEQILKIYDYLHEIDNDMGIIRQSEFFLYSEKDREAVEICLQRGYQFPEVTSWIRANETDFNLVKNMGIKETGMLMSCSDYHIFKKLSLNRKQAMEKYLSIAERALEIGIKPRCHLEDITRADFFGFVVPFVNNLNALGKKAGIQIKIRACDTLGLGLPYVGVQTPRSVPGIIHGLQEYCGLSSESIEWHGHNDYNNVVTNSTTAWLCGASSVNTTLLGIGERTGNCPLEAMLIEYAQFKGSRNINFEVINELTEYFEKEFDYAIDPKRPFVGSDFNMTKAGVHADGILKYEAIYNSFDTKTILGKPIVIKVNQTSGLAGIAAWINSYYGLKENNRIHKKDPRVQMVKVWIDDQYGKGRTTDISNDELKGLFKKYFTTQYINSEEVN
ncbi:MAG: 2-isopropylmalate synthase [Eubacteriales bacterium]